MSKAGSGIIRGDTEMEHFPLSASEEFTTQRTYAATWAFQKTSRQPRAKACLFQNSVLLPPDLLTPSPSSSGPSHH